MIASARPTAKNGWRRRSTSSTTVSTAAGTRIEDHEREPVLHRRECARVRRGKEGEHRDGRGGQGALHAAREARAQEVREGEEGDAQRQHRGRVRDGAVAQLRLAARCRRAGPRGRRTCRPFLRAGRAGPPSLPVSGARRDRGRWARHRRAARSRCAGSSRTRAGRVRGRAPRAQPPTGRCRRCVRRARSSITASRAGSTSSRSAPTSRSVLSSAARRWVAASAGDTDDAYSAARCRSDASTTVTRRPGAFQSDATSSTTRSSSSTTPHGAVGSARRTRSAATTPEGTSPAPVMTSAPAGRRKRSCAAVSTPRSALPITLLRHVVGGEDIAERDPASRRSRCVAFAASTWAMSRCSTSASLVRPVRRLKTSPATSEP